MEKEEQIAVVEGLNSHGFIFQKACVDQIKKGYTSHNWRISVEEYPTIFEDRQTRIDFILRSALYQPNNFRNRFIVAECKRANPKYSNWVFFKEDNPAKKYFLLNGQYSPTSGQTYTFMDIFGKIENYPYCLDIFKKSIFVDTGVETTSKNPKGKGSATETIENACQQVITGLHGLVMDHMEAVKSEGKPQYDLAYIPLVITTANLYVTNYDSSKVNISAGTIAGEDISFTSANWVIYNWSGIGNPLEKVVSAGGRQKGNIFSPPMDSQEMKEKYLRRSIIVVNSNHLIPLLGSLSFD